MSVALGYYEDKSGVVHKVGGVCFHSKTGEELVLVTQAYPFPKPEITYANKPGTVKGSKVLAVPRKLFDKQYPKFLGEWWSHDGHFLENFS